MIESRFNTSHMTEVSGNCDICTKPVTRRLPNGTAKKLKYLLCGGYRCKMKMATKKVRERKERLKAKGVKA
jgi:hypothetical protein